LFAVCCLLSSSPWVPGTKAILVRDSLVILGGAFSTHRLVNETKGKAKAGATVERVQHKVKRRVATKRRIGIEADGRTNDAIDSGERKKLRKEKMKERCESDRASKRILAGCVNWSSGRRWVRGD
jgi:hypothetical protein